MKLKKKRYIPRVRINTKATMPKQSGHLRFMSAITQQGSNILNLLEARRWDIRLLPLI